MRARPAVLVLALWGASCAPAPLQASVDDTEDVALLWSARLPGAIEGPIVLQTRDVAYAEIPLADDRAADIEGLALLDGALLVRRREVLGTEQLVVTAPPARWVAASGRLPGPVPAARDSKVEVILALERGSSSAVMFHVDGNVSDSMMSGKGSPPPGRHAPPRATLIGLDVVWPSTREVPTLTMTLGRIDSPREPPGE
jgi:hypothetical protein